MTRIIRIENCSSCGSRDHKGAFGRIPYIPICRAMDKELPYDVVTDIRLARHGVSASPTYEIPDWCPLEELTND